MTHDNDFLDYDDTEEDRVEWSRIQAMREKAKRELFEALEEKELSFV